MSTFEGAVLCGGASRRMGRDKALMTVGGRPFVLRIADALTAAGAARVTAIGGDATALAALGLDVQPDQWPGEGPLGGLVTALEAATHDLVAVLACDLVAPDPASIRATVDALASDPAADVVVPFVDGWAQLHHAAWRRSLAPTLRARFDGGDRSLHRALEACRVRRVEGIDRATLADADVPADLPGG